MEIDKTAVGHRIALIRKRKGLTLEEFGKKVADALKSNVSKWERGISLPNNERLKIIADLGDISVDELLYGDERNYINPLIVDIAAKHYNMAVDDDQEMINHIFNRLISYSYDSTEESLYSENKQIFDDILFYNFDMDSEGLIQISTLDLHRTMNKIKELTEERKDDLSQEECSDIEHTKNLILEILEQAYYDIEGIETNPKFSSFLKAQKELQKEIKENANKELFDPKHE